MKSLEQTLHEQDTELRELRKKVGKTGAATNAVQQLISESALPAAAQVRLLKRLPATASKDVVKAAIATEGDYVRKLTGAQRDLCGLVESYRLIGLSEKEANLAAGVEVAVKDISESRQRLANAAKKMGMSDSEAAIFSQI
jgi:hypothetical protein